MQKLRNLIPIQLSEQERYLLICAFPLFLNKIEYQGARFVELQALLKILQVQKESSGTDEILDGLLLRVTDLLEMSIPDPLTLEEASDIYHVNAATLRRACWAG